MKELIDEFLPPEQYQLIPEKEAPEDGVLHINRGGEEDRDTIKRELFQKLYAVTGEKPEWGILTGVRPVKLAGEMFERRMKGAEKKKSAERDAAEQVIRELTRNYFLSEKKAREIMDMYLLQSRRLGKPEAKTIGVYVGIPFCPTRCLYCSFASNQVKEEEIERYVPALLYEIRRTGGMMSDAGVKPESVYMGGGTPTTLRAEQMERILTEMENFWDFTALREFTCEAGRPDTITEEKIRVLRRHGINRISINPQSMKQRTLELIGRSHTPEDIRRAFAVTRDKGFDVINADLIAGLPEETPEDFVRTLQEVIRLGAENITVHTLAVKRASRLKEIDQNYYYKVAEVVGGMLDQSEKILTNQGFRPYYLYRQKHMAGSHQNTGYALPGAEGLYNVRVMDEHQSILALGAGGISKRYYPETNRLERVPNVTNYQEYIRRIDEMCERKEKRFFI